MPIGRKPDYRVAVMNKLTNEKNGNIGAAWKEDDGRIAIQLEGFLNLEGPNLLITLFPADKSGKDFKTKTTPF